MIVTLHFHIFLERVDVMCRALRAVVLDLRDCRAAGVVDEAVDHGMYFIYYDFDNGTDLRFDGIGARARRTYSHCGRVNEPSTFDKFLRRKKLT